LVPHSDIALFASSLSSLPHNSWTGAMFLWECVLASLIKQKEAKS
jgi:hypothetical protein